MTQHYPPQKANHVALTPLSFLQRTADVYPDRASLVYGTQRFTWQDTRKRCAQLANALSKASVKPGDTVSVLAFNTPEMFEAHFGVPMSGAVLNTINTRLDADTIAYILEHAEAKVLLVDRELLPAALAGIVACQEHLQVILINDDNATEQSDAAIANAMQSLNEATEHSGTDAGGEGAVTAVQLQAILNNSLSYQQFLDTGDADAPFELPADEWDALALNYTSGTTGRPKGVLYHHRGSYLMSMGTVLGWSVPNHPVYLYSVPMFHCNGWGHAWTMTALAATVVCLRYVQPKTMFDLIEEHGVTHFGGAPIVLNMMANAPAEDQKSFSRPIQVMTAGAPPPASVIQRMSDFGFNIMHVYGLTETYGHVLQAAPQAQWTALSDEHRAEKLARQGVRFPMNEAVDVVLGESLESVPHDGETMGEIVLRGNTIMQGYLKNPEATEEAFKDGWFWSGDLAVVHEDGYIQILDRAKDIIISGGENISSVEVENALYKHPAVAEAAVVAMSDEKWGESPCAFVTLRAGSEVTEQELIDFVATRIARFKRPKRVVFGEIPKTATGKIQKFTLRQQLR